MVRKDDLDFLRVLDGRLHSSEIVYYAGGPNVWGNKGLRHKFLEAKIKAAEIERLKEIVERNQDLAFGLSTVDYGFSPAYDILEIRAIFPHVITTNYLLRFCERQLPEDVNHQDIYNCVTKSKKNMSKLEFAGIKVRTPQVYFY
ncbi:MAG: hypothetical protein ABIH25_03050 [Candidatus Woesearchaeota archaeon]